MNCETFKKIDWWVDTVVFAFVMIYVIIVLIMAGAILFGNIILSTFICVAVIVVSFYIFKLMENQK